MKNHLVYIHLLVGIFVLVANGCKPADSKKEQTKSKNEQDGKLGDESEGIGGYFLAPEKVRIDKKGNGRTSISAPSGTIGAKDANKLSSVRVGVWATPEAFELGDQVTSELVACGRPNSKGALAIDIAALPTKNIFVTAGLSCEKKLIDTGSSEDGHAQIASLYERFCPEIFVPGKEATCSFTYNGKNYGGSSSLPVSDEEWEKVKEHGWYEGSDLQRDEESGLFDQPHDDDHSH